GGLMDQQPGSDTLGNGPPVMSEVPVAAYVPPPTYAPPQAPPRRGRRGGTLLIIAAVVLVVIAGLGGVGAYANAVLSDQYSPQRAVQDYFAAQQRGDAAAMLDNSTLLKGDGALSRYFDMGAVKAMLGLDQNRQLTGVKVVSTQTVDDMTKNVTVSMTWAGN